MKELILKTYKIAVQRGWNCTFWAIDIHDVIIKSNYKAGDIPTEFLGDSKKVLQRISLRNDIVLILYTCSYPNEIEQYLELFRNNKINFKYVNENPECLNTGFGFFEKKFYFNVLFEDKAGFIPERDWPLVTEALDIIDAQIDSFYSLP